MNTPEHRFRVDLTAARYLEAFEREDFGAMAELWRLALSDPDLEVALREVHAGLLEEESREASAAIGSALAAAVSSHLPSAEVVTSAAGPVTVGDVADEIFRHAPTHLPAEAHRFNERLRSSRQPLPEDLGLSKLTAWAEAAFGAAPADYWKAFRQAAVKLGLRRAAEVEYHLAARTVAPRTEDKR
jgi:hypothetical protein